LTVQTESLPRVQVLEPQGFDSRAGVWHAGIRPRPGGGPMLRLMTYNLWFDEYRWEERIAAALGLIERLRPDIVGLQEVTPAYLERILTQDWIRRRYQVSDSTAETLRPHGVLLLSRIPMNGLVLCRLPSQKDRKLLVAELETSCGTLFLGTVHLESSPESTPIRLEQLDRILPGLNGARHAVLMGDFNFDPADQTEQSRIAQRYTDLWPALRGDEPGYTADSELNAMRFLHKQFHKRVRFDRILLRSSPAAWRPVSIDLLGTEPVETDQPEVFPSDHFGLIGVIACVEPSRGG